jgi:uncharacterized protein (DUF433 family)
MVAPNYRIIGRGIYSLPDAHRITGVPARRIRRWATGYHFTSSGRLRHSAPVIANELSAELGVPALSFADLLEVRFLNAFREYGVKWKAIRIASERARDILGLSHPFSSQRFSTDGHTILARFVAETGDEVMLDLVRSQYEFERIIALYVMGEIEFDDHGGPRLWRPFPDSDRIVIDPTRSFGAPIIDDAGIPTLVLARAVQAEGSIETVAQNFDVDINAVDTAFRYEASRAAL